MSSDSLVSKPCSIALFVSLYLEDVGVWSLHLWNKGLAPLRRLAALFVLFSDLLEGQVQNQATIVRALAANPSDAWVILSTAFIGIHNDNAGSNQLLQFLPVSAACLSNALIWLLVRWQAPLRPFPVSCARLGHTWQNQVEQDHGHKEGVNEGLGYQA